MHGGGHQDDVGSVGGPLWRLLRGWPRELYRWNERRYEMRRVPYTVLQAATLGVLLGAYGASGVVGLLIAALSGRAAEDGFWVGVSVAGAMSMLALAYLLWGGLLEWVAKRRRGPASAP